MPTVSSKIRAKREIKSHRRSNGRKILGVKKYIYDFSEGGSAMRDLLGGKGAVLADMTGLGLPVPPGFTITTETCSFWNEHGKYPDDFWNTFETYLQQLELKTGKTFGSGGSPLLLSVRSGAEISMPGMMDTILNLGICDATIQSLIKKTGDERFCFDSYRRFINMFSEVVLGIEHEKFEDALDEVKKRAGVELDMELTAADLKNLVDRYKKIVKDATGKLFPENPREALLMAIEAVFRSWNSQRAKAYRKINSIGGLLGTAVNIQSMVFGNRGATSATGVAFTRNPSTGAREFYGEFLMNAQGEDVVAGIRTPEKISQLQRVLPQAYEELLSIQETLERHYKNMQDIEFTIEEGRLFMLQSRNGKRTARAAIKIATDMVKEGLITKKEAILQVDANQLSQLLHPTIPANYRVEVLCRGLPASSGAACGRVVFSPEDAVAWSEKNINVILVRKETSPEDIQGMFTAQGILTSKGGLTSHAAVVCRGMGKCCIAGCADISIDMKQKIFTCGDTVIKEGDFITLNGSTGEVILGETPLQEPAISDDFRLFMTWVDQHRRLKVRTNADTPKDAVIAREFGAEGIGLCRTEHMFFDENRIPLVREMILAKDRTGRMQALDKLLPLQKSDFIELFKVMDGYPVTIRLLDPPLHEFLPTTSQQMQHLADTMRISLKDVEKTVTTLHEINPMLGHRGCRLAVTYPEIYEMQVRAVVEAGIEVSGRGVEVIAEIELPLIALASELKYLRSLIARVMEEYGTKIKFSIKIGTMIELPRACITADEIALFADFFSFGTNDLTQMTYGLSRDDSGKFLPTYMEKGIIEFDPMATIDQKGVGELMKLCVKLGRSVAPQLEIGICGEHGGEAKSVEFCHNIGLNYVSCSPYRIPIAKLAAAQAVIKEKL